jgi:hypothetical protein
MFQECTERKAETTSVESDSDVKTEPTVPAVEQPKNVWKERANQLADKTSAPAAGNVFC